MIFFIGFVGSCFFAWLLFKRTKTIDINRREVRIILENFIEGSGGEWDWDDFISVPIKDAELEKIRLRCSGLDREFPTEVKRHYCNSDGLDVIRHYIEELK